MLSINVMCNSGVPSVYVLYVDWGAGKCLQRYLHVSVMLLIVSNKM